ncbi:MAG: ABC transporter ATP-binding protein [Candidatus Omnitrophota bacterium]|nr:ABC transporter ATP-binding protein [Candidatus Omnitrophota bacterium]
MNVIEFNGVYKKFRKGERFNSLRDAIPNLFRKNNGLVNEEFWALNNVSFDIKKGDVLGIIGPNGAGKSTILKLLSKIMNPNKGEIKIRGRISALIEVAAGFHDELTGKENIYLNGTILGMSRKEINSKFDKIVEFSGLAEFINTPVKRYSSGMHSRLGFSVAAHLDPDILLVDEVLAVGDISFQAKCAQKMRELLNSGATIVLVSHNLSLIQSLCKRVILLNKGVIAQDGATDEVIPYYENIVYQEQEQEIRKKDISGDYFLKPNQDTIVNISNVAFFNNEHNKKNIFKFDELTYIEVDYYAREMIESPVFSLDIIRADGVLCCSSNTKDNSGFIGKISGKGTVTIDLGKMGLAPGIYITKISVWDRDMIHPYVIRKKDIFRIETDSRNKQIDGIFLPRLVWSK